MGITLTAVALTVLVLVLDAARLAREATHAERPAAVTLLDRRGVALTTLGDGWSRPLALQDVSPHMLDAIVAIEDRRFFSHAGIDPLGLARAFVRNISAGRIAEGGSTITQQLAKLVFLTPERSFVRKLREATLALWLDATLEKQEILAAYLDRVYLGGGVTGVRAAARKHFGVEARSLDVAQSALLAGLVRAPSRLDPGRHPDAARERMAVVLRAMVATGSIDQPTADAALASPPRILAAYYVDPALRTLVERSRRLVPGSALAVATTLDAELGQRARAVLAEELAKEPRRASAAALLAISADGEVLAAASVPGTLGSLDRIADARRQPGSAFKPILFAAAIERGHRPDETISTTAPLVDGWRPRNIVEPPAAEVTLRQALALSINTAAVRLGLEVGLPAVIGTGRRLGIASDLPAVPSLMLGSAELRMEELAAAYAALSGDGVVRTPVWIKAIADDTGTRREPSRPAAVRALSVETARTMRDMLNDAMRDGTGKAALFPGGFGKTGTSSGFRDAWFVGGNDDGVITAVWAGNDDHTPMPGETGGGLPARIFRRFMTGAS
ncbi:transglycosylase domain-containing protein [Geminicoccus roseus]|uniref:transglycosylase domain-containing protein n=1 Tax=Geminicoccus roseus TaxID=404900 RepID=UPI00040DFAFB|nr:transglycosylase domain-containing protein [Geminicoccus roseus]